MSQDNNTNTMPVDPTEMLPQVEKLLYDLAWKFHRRYPLLPFEDAKSQSYWGFMMACKNWKPDRGAQFSSWVYFCASMHLRNLVMARSEETTRFPRAIPTFHDKDENLTELEDAFYQAATAGPAHSDVLDLVADLPEDAKTIVQMLLETPGELVGRSMTPRQLLRKVKTKLVFDHGLPRSRVETACAMLRERFQEAWA